MVYWEPSSPTSIRGSKQRGCQCYTAQGIIDKIGRISFPKDSQDYLNCFHINILFIYESHVFVIHELKWNGIKWSENIDIKGHYLLCVVLF